MDWLMDGTSGVAACLVADDDTMQFLPLNAGIFVVSLFVFLSRTWLRRMVKLQFPFATSSDDTHTVIIIIIIIKV